MQLKTSKKAQVTAFLIVAIILLFSSALIFYIRSVAINIEPSLEPVMQEVPLELKPIQSFIESCVEQVATDALINIGQHGGYINASDEELSGREFEIKAFDPTNSDAVLLSQFNENSMVPYWWYLKTDMNCVDCLVTTTSPSIENVEAQIEKYISRKLAGCLDDFKDFKEQKFNIYATGPINATARINEKDVSVLVNYPISVEKEDRHSTIDAYFVKLSLPLKEILKIASIITQHQANTQFLESLTMNLVGFHSGADQNLLPPISAIIPGYQLVIWTKINQYEKFKELLLSYIPLIQIKGSKNVRNIILPGANRFEEAFYSRLYWDVNLSGYLDSPQDYDISFLYLNWPYYFDINPSNGQLIAPNSYLGKMEKDVAPRTQINEYHFFYDIAFPVLVKISRENVLNNQRYDFLFALESNIKTNKNLIEWFYGNGTLSGRLATAQMSQSAQQAASQTQVQRRPIKQDLFCNINQRLSGNITIKTKDKLTGEPLEGVVVEYGCGDYASCPVGETLLDYVSNESYVEVKLPLCIGGYLYFEKEGYSSEVRFITTQIDRNSEVSVNLQPYTYLNFSIKKYVMFWNYTTTSQKFVSILTTPISLQPHESIMANIEKIKEQPWEEPLTSSFILTPETRALEPDIFYSMNTIRLVPGTYNLEITYLDNNGVLIPKKCKRICVDYSWWGSCKEHKYIPDNDINMTPAPLGGIVLTNKTRNFRVRATDLHNKSTLNLYVIRTATPPCIDEMAEMDKVDEYSRRYYNLIKPRFS